MKAHTNREITLSTPIYKIDLDSQKIHITKVFSKEKIWIVLVINKPEFFLDLVKNETDKEVINELKSVLMAIEKSIKFGDPPQIGDGIGLEIEYRIDDKYYITEENIVQVTYVLNLNH